MASADQLAASRQPHMRVAHRFAVCFLVCHNMGTSTAFASGPTRRSAAPAVAATSGLPQPALPTQRGRAALMADSGAAAGPQNPFTAWLVRNRSILLLMALVAHKCASDLLTRYTRVQGAYSITTVAMCAVVPRFLPNLAHLATRRHPLWQNVGGDEDPAHHHRHLHDGRRPRPDRARRP